MSPAWIATTISIVFNLAFAYFNRWRDRRWRAAMKRDQDTVAAAQIILANNNRSLETRVTDALRGLRDITADMDNASRTARSHAYEMQRVLELLVGGDGRLTAEAQNHLDTPPAVPRPPTENRLTSFERIGDDSEQPWGTRGVESE
jgi:hypothetical protein